VVGGIEWVTADGTSICRHVLYCGSTNKREKMSPLKSIFLEYYTCEWLGVVCVSHVTMRHMSHSVINVT